MLIAKYVIVLQFVVVLQVILEMLFINVILNPLAVLVPEDLIGKNNNHFLFI